jgi:hypothetical protein
MARTIEAMAVAVGLAFLAGCAHPAPAPQRTERMQDLGDLLQSSCDGGSGLACETLARALEVADGRGEQRERVAALKKKACQLGYQLSCPPQPSP